MSAAAEARSRAAKGLSFMSDRSPRVQSAAIHRSCRSAGSSWPTVRRRWVRCRAVLENRAWVRDGYAGYHHLALGDHAW